MKPGTKKKWVPVPRNIGQISYHYTTITAM